MANIGKAFSWITRTLLGTESPANLDRSSRRTKITKTNEILGVFSIFIAILNFHINDIHT